jgi:NADH dehydrogenase FAD-containing subunit
VKDLAGISLARAGITPARRFVGATKSSRTPVAREHVRDSLPFDTLIVSSGSHYNYFGYDQWQALTANLKTLEGALTIRRQILEAF